MPVHPDPLQVQGLPQPFRQSAPLCVRVPAAMQRGELIENKARVAHPGVHGLLQSFGSGHRFLQLDPAPGKLHRRGLIRVVHGHDDIAMARQLHRCRGAERPGDLQAR